MSALAALERPRLDGLRRQVHDSILIQLPASGELSLHTPPLDEKERYLRFYLDSLASELETSIAEHEAIVDAIRRGDPEAAGEAVEETCKNGADRLARAIERRGEWGTW